MTSHYSFALNPQKRALSTIIGTSLLIELCTKLEATPVLIFSGLSGVSNGTLISHLLYSKECPHDLIYVRKNFEFDQCHGQRIEHNIDPENKHKVLIFVDDFVHRGETRNRCLSKTIEALNNFVSIREHCTFHPEIYQLLESSLTVNQLTACSYIREYDYQKLKIINKEK